jgi:GT2 family glycosyltransferase
MQVCGVVVNYRVARLAVEAVASQLADFEGLDARVIVVDNDSKDGSYEHLVRAAAERSWGERVRVIASRENGGFGYGNNVAFRAAIGAADRPEFFFCLNPDAKVRRGTTRVLLDFMRAHPRAGIAGTRVLTPSGSAATSCFRFPSVTSEFESGIQLGAVTRLLEDHVVAMPEPEATCEVDWVSGSSFIVREAALERAGLFDENFFLYCEEIDLCRRVREAGYTVHHVHETAVEHAEAASTGIADARRRPRYWFDSRRYYFEKHHGRPYFVGAVLAWALGASVHRARCFVSRTKLREPPHLLRDQLAHLASSFTNTPARERDGAKGGA